MGRIIKYKCYKCGAENEFDVQEGETLILEQKVFNDSQQKTYVHNCSECGAKNEVEA